MSGLNVRQSAMTVGIPYCTAHRIVKKARQNREKAANDDEVSPEDLKQLPAANKFRTT